MIRDVAIVLDDMSDRAVAYGVSLAAQLDAFVTGISVSPDAPFETYSYAEIRYDMVVAAQETAQERARAAADAFGKLAKRANLRFETATVCDAVIPAQRLLLDRVRTYDLVVIEQREPQRPKPTEAHLEPLLLYSGRPSLVVPYIWTKPVSINTVTVAWDGSRPAARALADAIPFLQRASRVEIVCVVEGEGEDDIAVNERMARHLARHGVDAELRTIPTEITVSDTILSHIADNGTDLLVMGAYGHSRLREVVFGGVSRGILDTMTVPVLMSH